MSKNDTMTGEMLDNKLLTVIQGVPTGKAAHIIETHLAAFGWIDVRLHTLAL